MRGFFLGVIVLIGLDVATKVPASRFAELVATPAAWLAAWMDPRTPLISKPVPGSSATPPSHGSGQGAPTGTTGSPVKPWG